MKQTVTKFGKQSKSYMAVRKVKTYEDDFDQAEFAQTAQDIYVKAHEALAKSVSSKSA
jgi:large subunit ribosomal protein L45